MALSLAAIAVKIGAPPPPPPANQDPVWVPNPTIEFTQGVPQVILMSQAGVVSDPDGDPMDLGFSNVLAELAAKGIGLLDLGPDVEVRYDGRDVGLASGDEPLVIALAFVGTADDGKSTPPPMPRSVADAASRYWTTPSVADDGK